MGMTIQNGIIYSGNAERGYREHTLWQGSETPASTSAGVLVTLSDNISAYDEIRISVKDGRYSYIGGISFNTHEMEVGSLYIGAAYGDMGAYIAYTSDTSLTLNRMAGSTPITYLKVVGIKYSEVVAGSTYHKYSTSEKIVGEWIDGKLLYERTYTFTAPSSNTFTRVDLGIPMSEIDEAWIDPQNTFATNNNMNATSTFYDGSPKADQFGCYLNFLQTNLSFDYRVGSDLYSSDIVLTIRYTKSS